MSRKERFTRRAGARRLVHRYSVLLLTLLFGAAVWTGLAVYAADSDLDLTFDSDGIVTTAIQGVDQAFDVALQPDGKIVTVGSSTPCSPFSPCSSDFTVVRYNANGSLDTTFDSDGIVTMLGGDLHQANAVALQLDGKIVVAGQSFNGSQFVFTLVRLKTDGSLDTTFDSDGIVTTAIGSLSERAIDVAIQSDGKIVAFGASQVVQEVFALARYNANGSLDTTFDSDGIVTTAIGSVQDLPTAVALQSDGKIVAAGGSNNGSQAVFTLVRYNANGSLDTTFDSDGIVTTAIGSDVDVAEDVALQSDGKIVAAGRSRVSGSQDVFALARYNANGSLDTTFDSDGIVTTAIGSLNDDALAVALQSDGKIVAAGQSSVSGLPSVMASLAVVRYNTNGSLDTTFDSDGIGLTAVNNVSVANAVAIQPNGKIVAAGASGILDFVPFPPFFIATASFTVVRYQGTPISSQAQANEIIDQIEALITSGTLTQNQGDGLLDKLNQVITKLDQGQTTAACNQLNAFIAQVQGYINSGKLTSAQGLTLINGATALKASIGC